MFSVSSISNSYLNKILLYRRNSSADSDISAQVSDLDASDIVTLSSESLGLLEDLINSTGDVSSSTRFAGDSPDILDAVYSSASDEAESSDTSNESLDLLNVLLNSTANAPDTSAGSIYNVLISAQNENLIKNNPDLVNMIIAGEDTGSSDSSSSASNADEINLISMSTNEILNIIKKYREYSGSSAASTSLIDTTA
jgi:hypothetical protein